MHGTRPVRLRASSPAHTGLLFVDPLPRRPGVITYLQDSAARYETALLVVTDEGIRAALAEAVQAAERTLRLDSAHARELTAWTLPPGSNRTDGVPANAYPGRAERTFPDFPPRTSPGDAAGDCRR